MFQGTQDFDLDAMPALTPLRATTPMPQLDFVSYPVLFQPQHHDFTAPAQSPTDFAMHAEQLRQSLEQAGLVSCPASPRFEPCTPATPMVPFMGHVGGTVSSA